MAQSKAELVFDEAGSLAANLGLFKARLDADDPVLGPHLASRLDHLVKGDDDRDAILDELLQVLQSSSDPATTQTPAPASPPAPGAPAAQTTTWLLEGVAVEGFRGVNNEGSPLSLDFKVDEINSISAPNGVGKSSIFDALQYAIRGKLSWLDGLPAAERPADYYLNLFHPGSSGTIELRLVDAGNGDKVKVTVVHAANGTRTTAADNGADADALLATLDREFVLLDGPTFHSFISAPALKRGRDFAGLLGLAEYTRLRGALQALSNTKAFNGYFGTVGAAQFKLQLTTAVNTHTAAIAKDYAELVGEPLAPGTPVADGQERCRAALENTPVLTVHCAGKPFPEIDLDACIKGVKEAEGGDDRARLAACLRKHGDLAALNLAAPDAEDLARLNERAQARAAALALTAGDALLELYTVGDRIMSDSGWEDPSLCPLCDDSAEHSVHDIIRRKLSSYNDLTTVSQALATEWNRHGWSSLIPLERALLIDGEIAILLALRNTGEQGALTEAEAVSAGERITLLRDRASSRLAALTKEREALEAKLPASLVQVTSYVETARRLQESWRKLEKVQGDLTAATRRETSVARLKTFLDRSCSTFAAAESTMAAKRLSAVEPLCRTFFEKLNFYDVVPTVFKKAGGEELQIKLAQFFNLTDQSPQALLSESFRNAFAISLYLAAATLFAGAPHFIVLDDVTSSFDAGHQMYLVELLRTGIARPILPGGLQVIMFSHDTMLEKLFNKHSGYGGWSHQRLEGTPHTAILQQAGAVNKVSIDTMKMLSAGRADEASPRIRQYLEYILNEIVTRLRIPVPIDLAFGDSKKTAGEYIKAIEAAVALHQAASQIVLEPVQIQGLNSNMTTIVGNYLSHWESGQTTGFSANALTGVMKAIDAFADCFKFSPAPGAPLRYYKSLSKKA